MSITGLHHVGHVVHDMPAALDLYQRLGFQVHPPAYPAMPPSPGEPPEPFGAANTHADFPGNFLELATVVTGPLPPGAKVIPLDAHPAVRARIEDTATTLRTCLARHEGLHILMFTTTDIESTAVHMSAEVTTVRRGPETIRYLELNDPPEGRVGAAETLTTQSTTAPTHPNGATALADATICTTDLEETRLRYERYLNQPAVTSGEAGTFPLGDATLTLLSPDALPTLYPGETAPSAPALAACTIRVENLTATRALLRNNGVEVKESATGTIFVPAKSAMGATLAFTDQPTVH